MLRVAEQFADHRRFDDPAGVHHRHAIGHLGDDAEVVRDQEQRQAEALLQIAEQIEDLGLNGHIECSRRLVGDEQGWIARQRNRDQGPLAQAAGEVVRIIADASLRIRHAYCRQQLDGALPGGASARDAVDGERLLDLAADREDRVQGRHRLLEDQRDSRAANLLHRSFVELHQVAPVEPHRSAGDATRTIDQPKDRQRRHRLAAAGFTDQAERLPLVDVEAHVDHRRRAPGGQVEYGGEVADGQEQNPRSEVRGPRIEVRRSGPLRSSASGPRTSVLDSSAIYLPMLAEDTPRRASDDLAEGGVRLRPPG